MDETIPPARPPSATPDVALLTRAMCRGEEEAFRQFYDAYFDRLLRYLLVVTGGDEAAAREALQLTLLRVVRHVKPFAAEEKFWSWLTVLARSARTDESRKQRRYFAFLERFTRHAEVENTAGNDGEADAWLRQLLERNVASLPPEERAIIAQKYFERRSIREIAAAQSATEKAVESKLARIRRKLKEAVFDGLKNG